MRSAKKVIGKSKFSENQILASLGEGDAGLAIARGGVNIASLRQHITNGQVNMLACLPMSSSGVKGLEAENNRFKRMYADLALEYAVIKGLLLRM